MSVVGASIKRIIDESGFEQKAIAQRASYDEKKFSNMLAGREDMLVSDIVRLALVLDVSANDLFRK